jgi:sigma-E factor negative regulatory protein RseA
MSTPEKTAQDTLHESLSALMDGEATELELRRILKSEDESLEERWHRYHLASAALRGEYKLDKPVDLASSISAAIQEEPSLNVKSKDKGSNFWSNFGRFAVAASVAGAFVVGVQFAPNETVNNIAEAPITTPAPALGQPQLGNDTNVSVVSQDDSRAIAPRPVEKAPITINEDTRQQLQQMGDEINHLMLEHAQNASQNTQQGVLPYVRVPEGEQ